MTMHLLRRILVAAVMLMLVSISGAMLPVPGAQAEQARQAEQQMLEQRRPTPQTSVDIVSSEVMCPSCDATLDQSSSPAAERMRAWIAARVDAGWTRQEIREGLVAEYGGDESVLATPDTAGLRGRLAWIVPAGIALVLIVAGVMSLRSWRRAAQ